MGKALDINTPLGQESLLREKAVIERIKEYFSVDFIETDKKGAAICDGFIVKNKVVRAIVEIKCRNLSQFHLPVYGEQHDKVLISWNKIRDGIAASKFLRIPYLVIIHLRRDNLIGYWKITDSTGKELLDLEVQKEYTQNSVNGGTSLQTVTFLPINECTLFPM